MFEIGTMIINSIIMYISFTSFLIKDTYGITNGRQVIGEKRYMVYLLRSPQVSRVVNYSAWLCGGAIIHPLHILTSASCILNVELVYVISGYKKYVNADLMEDDECIMKKRKRIIYTCYNKLLNMKYQYRNNYWNYGDIAVARLDSAFDFYDMSYYHYCSYPPGPIKVNVANRFIQNDLDVLTYGWGHRSHFRPPDVDIDMNEPLLRYSSAKLMKIGHCFYNFVNKKLSKFIKHYMYFYLCAFLPGHMDENGIVPDENLMKDGCLNDTRRSEMNASRYSECLDKNMNILRENDPHFTKTIGGFCQNDHGGPLITYIGGQEILIGLATAFWLTKSMECRAPYAYTNTRCMGKVIQCTLNPSKYRRSGMCDRRPIQKNVIERNITWPDD